jgi:hypothetical protein
VKISQGVRLATMSISYAASVMVANPFLVAKADLHPIVEVQFGYLFGATTNSKWIKSDEAAKAISDERTYKIYGLRLCLTLNTRCRFH